MHRLTLTPQSPPQQRRWLKFLRKLCSRHACCLPKLPRYQLCSPRLQMAVPCRGTKRLLPMWQHQSLQQSKQQLVDGALHLQPRKRRKHLPMCRSQGSGRQLAPRQEPASPPALPPRHHLTASRPLGRLPRRFPRALQQPHAPRLSAKPPRGQRGPPPLVRYIPLLCAEAPGPNRRHRLPCSL